MQLSVQGRQIDVGDAFREHASLSLGTVLGKYFGDAIDVSVTLSREGHQFRAMVATHIGKGIELHASAEAAEPYPAFDQAVERLSKRLRRYKRRLRDHHRDLEQAGADVLAAQQYVLQVEESEADEEAAADHQPAVIAEIETEIPSLTVSDAVMRMDLADVPALLFRNKAHGGLNMLYRRPDGNVGWVDPRGNRNAD